MDFISSTDQILAKGAKFPPPGSVRSSKRDLPGRLDTYATNKRLWAGQHDLVYTDWSKVLDQDKAVMIEVIVNFHRRLTRLWKALLLTEPPTFKVNEEAQEWVETLVKETRLIQALGADIQDMSRFGVGLLKVTADPKTEARVRVKAQTPLIGDEGTVSGGWFPIVDPMDRTEVTGHVIAWKEVRKEQVLGVPVNRSYLNAEVHERGKVTIQKWSMDGDTVKSLLEEQVMLTATERLTLIPAQNNLTSDSPYGVDDYTDIDSLLHEVELRLSQISKVLDVHADPNLQGPHHLTGGAQATARAVQAAGGQGQPQMKLGSRFFGLNPDDPKVEYVTWDGNLEAAFKEVEVAMDLVYLLSETSPAAFGQFKQGLAESGSALKRLMMAPLLKVADLRNSLDEALYETLMAANAIARSQSSGIPELTEVEVEWKDGLPSDQKELAEVETAMHGAGLTTKKSSISRVYGLEGEALDEEVEAIEQADSDKAASFTLGDPDRPILPPPVQFPGG